MSRVLSSSPKATYGVVAGLLASILACSADDAGDPAKVGGVGGAGEVGGSSQNSSGSGSIAGSSNQMTGGADSGAAVTTGSSGATGAGGSTGGPGAEDAAADAPGDAVSVVDAKQEVHLTDAGAFVRTDWTAVGTPPTPPAGMRNPDTKENLSAINAFDGRLNTRWGTGLYQNAAGQLPETFTVDMKVPVTFRRITLDPGSADEADYPASCDVYISTDGTNFGTAVLTGHVGKVNLDTITLPQAVTAQYIRLINNKANPNHWWAIAEMNVYP